MSAPPYGTIWASIPQTGGSVFWVAPSASYSLGGRLGGVAYSASDGNDGLDPRRALLTLGQAITNASANQGDVIVLLPGAHSWAASVAASKAGLTIMGLPGGMGNFVRPKTSITTTAADEIINVTAADIEIANLRIIPVTTKAGIDFTSAANRLFIHDCSIDLTATANTGTQGIAATTAAQAPAHLLFQDIYVEAAGAQGPAIEVGDATDYIVRRVYVHLKSGTWAAAMSGAGVTNQRGIWDSNRLLPGAGSTMTIGIRGSDLTSSHSVLFVGNFFGQLTTKAFDDYGSADADIAENYQGSSGGSGGALVTAIT